MGNYHPIIVHFPIALLAVAPLFMLASLLLPAWRKSFLISTLIMLAIGTIGIFAAVASGEAASEMIPKNQMTSQALKVLNEHYEHGEQTRLLYSLLLFVFALFVFAEKKVPAKLYTLIHVALTLCACGLVVLLFETGHYGGELVHKHHIHSQLFDNPSAAAE